MNSSVVEFGDEYRGVFRVDNQNRDMLLHAGRSRDGIAWELEPEPIQWACQTPEIANFAYGYDPRITPLDGRYYTREGWEHTEVEVRRTSPVGVW